MEEIVWTEYQFGELLSYEQPTPYIVESTEYNDNYPIPVLTPGKSFILGYTNEKSGVYDKLPVIIFDDFTTASRHVNFPFKVKSSAMKILTANPEVVDSKFIYYRMQIIDFDCSTHKRYWIQAYSKIKVLIPPLEEQKRIVARIEELFSELDAAEKDLNLVKKKLLQYRRAVVKEALTPALHPEIRWTETVIENVCDCLDSRRKPVKKSERSSGSGIYPYYGANGITGMIDDYLFDEELVLVVEDETFVGRVKPFSYIIRGKSWVNNHAHILRGKDGIITNEYLNYLLSYYPFLPLTTGTTGRKKLTKKA